MTRTMTRERVAEIIAAARAKGERPDLCFEYLADLDLRGLNLSGANLTGAYLRGADLTGAVLSRANLTGAHLPDSRMYGADLSLANLTDAYLGRADLRDATMMGAYMSRSDLYGADLYNANLRGAYLVGANLIGANLAGADMMGLALEGLPSGPLVFLPALEGWELTIGCWHGTTTELREMIAKDTGWPEAQGEVVEVRRPMLEAAADMCDAYAAAHPNALKAVKVAADRWTPKIGDNVEVG